MHTVFLRLLCDLVCLLQVQHQNNQVKTSLQSDVGLFLQSGNDIKQILDVAFL